MGAFSNGNFSVRIELGNDAMRFRRHVAEALRTIADKISDNETAGIVRDVNGNRVGTWGVSQ